MDEVPPRLRGPQGLLGNRNFVLLAAGQAIARGGDGLYVALLTWAAWKISRQAGAVAVVSAAATGPAVAAAVIGASIADRFGRRRLLHRLRPEQRAARTGSEPISTGRRATCCP